MADLHQVVINESTENENISLEEQARLQDEAAEAKKTATPIQEENTTQEETTTDRPEWLDEKFETPEDLAKAYQELQSKLGKASSESKESEGEKGEEEVPNGDIQVSITNASKEFQETGELSEASIESLEKAGIPREYVQAYINGTQLQIEQQVNEIKEYAGGSEAYDSMTSWAVENLSDTEIDAFNEIVESGTVEQAKIAIRGLMSRYQSENGGYERSPKLIQGGTKGSGVTPFTSAAQVRQAMRDPRYATDPAYRQEVERRMAVSSNPFG